MATRLGPKAKKSLLKQTPAPAEDPVPLPRDRDGEEDSSGEEELDTRAMVEEQLRFVAI